MIVHNVTIRESGPDGLIAWLEPHAFERAAAVEARLISESHFASCGIAGCARSGGAEITIHRLHSRRESELAYLCALHMEAHRTGDTLRLVVESNR